MRFGIIGCSKIAERSTIPSIIKSTYAELSMIGSRSLSKAEKFAKKFNCSKFGTYESVLSNESIDAVYISLPIGLHEKWTIKAAKAGKHVLCEKSSTISYQSAQKMIDCCKQNNVRLMEAFMFRFHPQHKKVLELIKDEILGGLFIFQGSYGFPPVSLYDTRYDVNLGGGVLNETGCYPICASRIVFREKPIGVLCNLVVKKETKVDLNGHAYILYENQKAAQISFSFEHSYQANYKVWGSKGTLELNRAYAIPPDLKTTIQVNTQGPQDKITIEPANHFKLMIDSFCKELLCKGSCDYNFENDLLIQACVIEAARISNKNKKLVYLEDVTYN